jgi:hypothetical protein
MHCCFYSSYSLYVRNMQKVCTNLLLNTGNDLGNLTQTHQELIGLGLFFQITFWEMDVKSKDRNQN